MPTMITIQTEMPSDRPAIPVITMSTSTTNTNTMTSSGNGDGGDRMPTVQTTADTSTLSDVTSSSSMNPMSTNPMGTHPTFADKPETTENQQTSSNPSIFSSSSSSSGSGSSIPTTNLYPNTVDSIKGPGIPPTMITTTMDRFPSTSTTYGSNTNTDITTNEVKPQTYPPTIYMSSGSGGGSSGGTTKPDDFGYPYPPSYHHKYNFFHGMYPFYTYPTIYETNYPNSYPASSGNGGDGYAQTMPTISYTPTVDYYGTTPSMTTNYDGNNVPNTASTYMGNGWSNADEIHRRKNGGKYPDRDYSGTYPEGKYNETGAGKKFNGTTRAPTTVPYIRTYFNPDDYLTNAQANAKSEYDEFERFEKKTKPNQINQQLHQVVAVRL